MIKKKAKIVATLGPSSNDAEIIEKMILAGMDVARLNFSHGSHKDHANKMDMVRNISKKVNKPITILQDLQGPKLRIGKLPEEGIILKAGDKLKLKRIVSRSVSPINEPEEICIPLDIPNITERLRPGSKILLDDGKLELIIHSVSSDEIQASVLLGGTLYSHKGVNLPGTNLDITGFTEKDREDLLFGLKNEVDAVALSFVYNAQDIFTVREFIARETKNNESLPIIAKLELPEAINNLDEILNASDGVMVARGDLAVETSPSVVPIMQKEIIYAANIKSKLVITATQMLDSMIKNPRPTRAEASDVANAILDGTDAVMLSGETASGDYPLESVEMMSDIILEAEAHSNEWGHIFPISSQGVMDDPKALSFAARELANDRDVSAISVFTQTGRSAMLISKVRPDVPILAFTPVPKTYQRLGLYWGVHPYFIPFATTLEEMISHVEHALLSFTSINIGQKVVIISGFPISDLRPANLALLHTIGERKI